MKLAVVVVLAAASLALLAPPASAAGCVVALLESDAEHAVDTAATVVDAGCAAEVYMLHRPGAWAEALEAALNDGHDVIVPEVAYGFAFGEEMARVAARQGAVLVVPAGNDGPGGCAWPAAWWRDYPEAVMCVAATAYGDRLAGWTQYDLGVFAAWGTAPDGRRGTSAAAPRAAAAVARCGGIEAARAEAELTDEGVWVLPERDACPPARAEQWVR